MGYDARIIAPQLRALSADRLAELTQIWHDQPAMQWLISREQAFRARWPDETDTNAIRAQELTALLTCHRTRADFCEWADTPPRQSCADCPYASGDCYGSIISPSCTHQKFQLPTDEHNNHQ